LVGDISDVINYPISNPPRREVFLCPDAKVGGAERSGYFMEVVGISQVTVVNAFRNFSFGGI